MKTVIKHKKFLEAFVNSDQWNVLKEIIEEYRDIVTNVNDTSMVKFNVDTTNGEKYVGKKISGIILDSFIGEIERLKKKKITKTDERDNFN